MSAEIPVTKAAIVTESGSTSSPTCTFSPPTWNQVKRCWVYSREPGWRRNRAVKTITVTTKEAVTIAVASQPAQGLPRRRPKSESSR